MPGILIAAFAGLLMALPSLDQRAFGATWVGMTVLIGLATHQPAYRSFRFGVAAGALFAGTVLHWIPRVAADSLNVSIVSGTMLALVIVAWEAIRFGVFAWLTSRLQSRGWSVMFVGPVLWVTLEQFWPHVFPWRIAHTQLGWLQFVQSAELVGGSGTGWFMVWCAASWAALARQFMATTDDPPDQSNQTTPRTNVGRRDLTTRRRVALRAGVAAVLLVGWTCWGGWRIRDLERIVSESPRLSRPAAEAIPADAGSVGHVADAASVRSGKFSTAARLKVALIQPGPRSAVMRETLRGVSRRVRDNVDLIVWPESSAGRYSLDLDDFRSESVVRDHSRNTNDEDLRPCANLGRELLCVGSSYSRESPEQGPYYNTAWLIGADEQILDRYHKRALMPWGEYVVGQQFVPGLVQLLGGTEYIAGTSHEPLTMPNGARLGVLICYEDLLESPARESCRAGAQVLINLNNLSIFGRSAAMWQHQQIAAFRAIENRRSLIRCGLVGPTTVIAATGRIEQQASTFESATLIANIPLLDLRTIASRHGQIIDAICPVICLLLIIHFFIAARCPAQSEAKQEQK